jgi:3-oxoadipate enol-lactonase
MPHFTTTDGCKIFYTTYGVDASNPVVIFLNGITQTTMYWGTHVPAFSKRYRLLFYDARGQGQSGLGDCPISLKLHISDLKDLMVRLAFERASLVGISHGSRVALEFAVGFPQLVDRLVLCSFSGRTSPRCRAIVRSWLEILQLSDLRAMAWAALPAVFGNKFLKHHRNMLDKIVNAVVIRNRKKALIAQLEAVLRFPPPKCLPAGFNKPTLVMTGTEDILVESDDIRQLVDSCKANHEELVGIGHGIPAEAPELFEKLVLEFLDSNA